jgi:hypothetical protein
LIEDKQIENIRQSQIENQDDQPEQDNNNTNKRVMMKDIIDIVRKGNIEEIYQDADKYFLFHQICVMNVLFKTKWKKNRLLQTCFKYTDVSDDAFAFLILENNAARYIDMADENKDSQDYSLPIYTDAIGKVSQHNSRNLKGRGWSREGMIRFQKLQMKIEDLYESDPELIESLGQSVLEKYRDLFGKKSERCINEENIESDRAKNNREKEDKEWDEFMRRNAKRRKQMNQGNATAI